MHSKTYVTILQTEQPQGQDVPLYLFSLFLLNKTNTNKVKQKMKTKTRPKQKRRQGEVWDLPHRSATPPYIGGGA